MLLFIFLVRSPGASPLVGYWLLLLARRGISNQLVFMPFGTSFKVKGKGRRDSSLLGRILRWNSIAEEMVIAGPISISVSFLRECNYDAEDSWEKFMQMTRVSGVQEMSLEYSRNVTVTLLTVLAGDTKRWITRGWEGGGGGEEFLASTYEIFKWIAKE